MANPRKTNTDERAVPPAADVADVAAIRQAAEKRKAATEMPEQDARMIDALLVERRGYVQRDLADRVAQVDEQIRLRGGTPPTS